MSLQMQNKLSVNLSSFDQQLRTYILSLQIIEDVDNSIDVIQKYKYVDSFYVLKTPDEFYFIDNQLYSDSTSPVSLKLSDYKIYQRKQKLSQIQKNEER